MEAIRPLYKGYAILDSEDRWHSSKLGALLDYSTEAAALEGMKEHGGAKVIRVDLYYDGTRVRTEVCPDPGKPFESPIE